MKSLKHQWLSVAVVAMFLPSVMSGASGPLLNPGPIFGRVAAFIAADSFPASIAVADVNGDGKPDLVVASMGDGNVGLVGVLLGNGDGTFQSEVTYASGGYDAVSVAVTDVNGDGKLDLLVANQESASVGVLLGNGDGTFQAVKTYISGVGSPESIAVADVNGDGKPDLLVAITGNNFEGSVGVLLGNGDGTFQPVVLHDSGGTSAESVVVMDANGDGKPDILVSNSCGSTRLCSPSDGNVSLLLGNGDGTFQAAAFIYGPLPGQYSRIAVADVNGDGKPDLLVTDQCGNKNCIASTVAVLLGKGDGTFQTPMTYNTGGRLVRSIAVADVNGDGKLDLLLGNGCTAADCTKDNVVGVLLGNGDGTFQTARNYAPGAGNAWSIAVADVNGDGRPDLVVAGNLNVFLGLPARTITQITTSTNPSLLDQPVTFTATVNAFYIPIPDGESVTFSEDGAVIGTGTTLNGRATFTTTSLSAKTHRIKASYSGDVFSKPSWATVEQVINF